MLFLMPISTFRRRSDLQSLRIVKGSICVHKKGITFTRHGLAKEDREGHYGSKYLRPLYWYLKNFWLLTVCSGRTAEWEKS